MFPFVLVFSAVCLGGLLAAKRPDIFAQWFFDERQRKRLAGRLDGLSWTGWIIFGLSLLGLIVGLIA